MTLPLRLLQWKVEVEAAAHVHGVDPYLLYAIIDRESLGGDCLNPRGPTGVGDGGHGRGLCQIDDRAHPELISQVLVSGQPAWQNPGVNIAMGANILAHALTRFRSHPDVPDAEVAAIAAYNAGEGSVANRVSDITKPVGVTDLVRELDPVTTEGNYVSDVLLRRSRFLQATPNPVVSYDNAITPLPEEDPT